MQPAIIVGTAVGQFTDIDAFLIEVGAIAVIPVLLRRNLIYERLNKPHAASQTGDVRQGLYRPSERA